MTYSLFKNSNSPIWIYLPYDYRSHETPDAFVDTSELVHSCFCTRGSVTSGRGVGGMRGERKRRERIPCLNRGPAWYAPVRFSTVNEFPRQRGRSEMNGLCRRRGVRKRPLKETRASTHLSQSSRYCQQARGDLNRVKLAPYVYSPPYVCVPDHVHRRQRWFVKMSCYFVQYFSYLMTIYFSA